MPNFNGTGCLGAGLSLGKGMGPFGRTMSWGRGSRARLGYGRQCGWFSAGYGTDDSPTRMEGIKSMLEQRADFFKMELERTESALKDLEN